MHCIDKLLDFNRIKAIKVIQRYQVISFDIFDTLIKRNVSLATQIFDIVETRYNRLHPEKAISGFKNMRIRAEQAVREETPSREITYEEIYKKCASIMTGEVVESLQDLMDIEVQTEIDYCEPNIPVRDVYQQCLSLGKRVIIISDMYLPKTIIEIILEKCGIIGYERLYLSSEVGKQKKTGELFDYVIKDIDVKAKNILHFGDRKKADNLMPRLKGMKSFYVEPIIQNYSFLKKEDLINSRTPLFAFVNNRLPRYSDYSDVFCWGYEAFGPLLLGFVTWVHEQIVEKKIEKAYFLARDMNLIFQVYRKIYGENGIAYLEVSRASLRQEYIHRKGNLSSIFDTMGRREYTVKEVINQLKLDNVNEIIAQIDISPDEYITCETDIDQPFLSFSRYIMDRLNSKENNVSDYLKQYGLFEDKKSAVVDIGWHGTTQNMLETITGKKLIGLYFGNTKRSYFPNMSIFGYWFSEADEEQALPYLPMEYILETMLFNNIGTVIGYEKKEGIVSPVYGNCEMTDFYIVEEFQKGAMQFVYDYTTFVKTIAIIPSEEAVKAYKMLAFYPTLAQARKFSEMPYEDGKIYKLANAKSLIYYLVHPGRLLSDYQSSVWKEGFIKQVLPFLRNPYRVDMMIKKIIRALGIKKI